jgi:hypothetical protein
MIANMILESAVSSKQDELPFLGRVGESSKVGDIWDGSWNLNSQEGEMESEQKVHPDRDNMYQLFESWSLGFICEDETQDLN